MHAQVRGKTVYLQYSTRNEIINSTVRAGEGGGSNILLVSLENMDVSAHLSHFPLLLLLHARRRIAAIARVTRNHSIAAASDICPCDVTMTATAAELTDGVLSCAMVAIISTNNSSLSYRLYRTGAILHYCCHMPVPNSLCLFSYHGNEGCWATDPCTMQSCQHAAVPITYHPGRLESSQRSRES